MAVIGVITTYVSQNVCTLRRNVLFFLFPNPFTSPLDANWNEMLVQSLLNDSRTFLVPRSRSITEAVRREGVVQSSLERSLGLGRKSYRDRHEMLCFRSENVEELTVGKHINSSLIFEVFEILQCKQRSLYTVQGETMMRREEETYKIRVVLINLIHTSLSWKN